ncbi:multiheme c-type cytochrome [Desulfurivibrio alkaliphilus]|uniref:multiheme c-type cytochrome n=1 Tax=Desulfurivibrio alkaliphilus TaxID=427923 RepID=UPI00138944AF|nr:ABC transporter C-terminal domain-containing protein [Desulfurivibrio alkaliphilus]
MALLLGLGACSGDDGKDGKDVDPAVAEGLQQQIADLEAALENAFDPEVIAELEQKIEELEAKLDGDVPVTVKSDYVGAQTCGLCHKDEHAEWKGSWHTRKSTWGPAVTQEAFESVNNSNKTYEQHQQAALDKFLPGVRENWDMLSSYMVLAGASLADVPSEIKDKAEWAGVNRVIYVTDKQYDWDEIEVIIGETRKQRYAVYYDGGPVEAARYAYSKDNGISWTVDEDMDTVSFAGDLRRAGYKFLTIELDALKASKALYDAAVAGETVAAYMANIEKSSMYGTTNSWQEQCIACHTTGFDADAWVAAKAAYVEGETPGDELRQVFISEIEISCETCHGPGRAHAESFGDPAMIVNPAALAMTDPTRKMACEQCHTRAQKNLIYEPGSAAAPYDAGTNDNRGFVLGEHDFMDVMQYTRPAWGTGNRQVSIDGKGRRDHQQDMDIRLSYYAKGGEAFYHYRQACFDCHSAHGVGKAVSDGAGGVIEYTTDADKTLFTTTGANPDPDGRVRLNKTRVNSCGMCHGDWEDKLDVFNGRTGWEDEPNYPYGFGAWGNRVGRADRKQHIFNTDSEGRSFGLRPDRYTWGQQVDGSWVAIWPWEKVLPDYVNYVQQEDKP